MHQEEIPTQLSEEILPVELWYKIFFPLDCPTLLQLESTCKNFLRILRNFKEQSCYFIWRREYLNSTNLIMSNTQSIEDFEDKVKKMEQSTTERYSINWRSEAAEVHRIQKNWRIGNYTRITNDVHTKFVCQVSQSSDALFGGGGDGRLVKWLVESTKDDIHPYRLNKVKQIEAHSKCTSTVRCTRSGVLTGSWEGRVKFWDFDLKRGKEVLKCDTARNCVEGMLLLEDANIIALARNYVEGVQICDVKKDKIISVLRTKGDVWSLDSDPTKQKIVSGSHDGVATVWDWHNEKRIAKIQASTPGMVNSAFKDEYQILTGGKSGFLCLWDIRKNQPQIIKSEQFKDEHIYRISLNSEVTLISTNSAHMIFLDNKTFKTKYVIRDPSDFGRLNDQIMDDRKLITSNGDGTVRLYSFETKQEPTTVKKKIKRGVNKSLRSGPIKMGGAHRK